MRSPNASGDGRYFSAYSGSNGITIPKPRRSMKTVRKTIRRTDGERVS
jgi:hypothetical protein